MRARLKWGALAVAPVLLLALAPQIFFVAARGRDYRGEFFYAHGDEVTYAAYLNALLDGRPRRSDPYTGRDERPGAPLAESYISLQFAPPLAVSSAGRLLGLDTARLLTLVVAIASIASALAAFWLLTLVLRDPRLACAGALAVLFLSSTYQVVKYALRLGVSNNFLPFLRLYLPAAPFPLLFVFLALVWLMLTSARARTRLLAAAGAGLVFAVLVFSYFYLWTTAAAWLVCLAPAWLLARPRERRGTLASLAVVALIAAAALAPYAAMLARRAADTDAGLLLARTHRPDLIRLPEFVAAAVLLALFVAARRGLVAWREPESLFAVACALAQVLLFNQQVLTGRSLQPFHYEMFSANYLAVLGAFVCAATLARRARPEATNRRLAFALTMTALASGAAETALACRTRLLPNRHRDDARPAALSLADAGRGATGVLDTRSLVFAPEYSVADYLPTVAPQPVLWAPHMFNHPGVTLAEDRERLMQSLYLSGEDFAGLDPARLAEAGGRTRYLASALVGRSRHNPDLAPDWKPISPDEVRRALDSYAAFARSFDHERAARYRLAYVLVGDGDEFDPKNLDRWYERSAGERHGPFVLYRVRLRETP